MENKRKKSLRELMDYLKKRNQPKGMSPEDFFQKHVKQGGINGDEEDLGEPDNIEKHETDDWITVKKIWNTENGEITREFSYKKDGSNSKSSGSQRIKFDKKDERNQEKPNFNPFMGSMFFGGTPPTAGIININDLIQQMLGHPYDDENDPDYGAEFNVSMPMMGMVGYPGGNEEYGNSDDSYKKMLYGALEEAEKEEDYETAAKIRDTLKQIKKDEDQDKNDHQ